MKFILSFLVFVFMLVSCQSKPEYQEVECEELELIVEGLTTSCKSAYCKILNDRDPSIWDSIYEYQLQSIFQNIHSSLIEKDKIKLESNFIELKEKLRKREEPSMMMSYSLPPGNEHIGSISRFIYELKALRKVINFDNCLLINQLQIKSYELRLLNCLYGYVGVDVFTFNKCRPIVFGSQNSIDKNAVVNIAIGAYDSISGTTIKYCIDDSLRSPENMFGYWNKGTALIQLKLKGLDKGKHIIYGSIEIMEKGVENWENFQYEFEVK
jgi:hypothetical protein